MKVAITGSSGFIGSHLVEKLFGENYEVIEIDLKKGLNLLDWESLKKTPNFDYLVHLAAKIFVPNSYENSFDFYNTNINGTFHALELCKARKAKMIFFSSYVYGQPQYLPIDENHPVNPFNPYADTKIKGEELCKSYNKFFDVPITVFRPFNPYGPKLNSNFLISKIISLVKSRKEIILDDPEPKRDFIYISDIVDAVERALSNNLTGYNVFNLGSGKSYSVKELVSYIQRIFDFEINVKFTGKKRKNEVMDTVADISKIKKELDWLPKVNLKEGLEKLYDDVQK